MKKFLAALLAVIMLMVPSMGVFAATNSPALVDLNDSKVKKEVIGFKYTGELKDATYNLTYNGQKLVLGKDFIFASDHRHINVNTYTVKLKGIGKFTGTIYVKYSITKTQNVVALNQTGLSVNYSKTKSSTVSTQKGNGAITGWKVVGLLNPNNAKYISVDMKTGKVTVKKGAPKNGIFRVQIRYAGDANHCSRTTTVCIKVK